MPNEPFLVCNLNVDGKIKRRYSIGNLTTLRILRMPLAHQVANDTLPLVTGWNFIETNYNVSIIEDMPFEIR